MEEEEKVNKELDWENHILHLQTLLLSLLCTKHIHLRSVHPYILYIYVYTVYMQGGGCI